MEFEKFLYINILYSSPKQTLTSIEPSWICAFCDCHLRVLQRNDDWLRLSSTTQKKIFFRLRRLWICIWILATYIIHSLPYFPYKIEKKKTEKSEIQVGSKVLIAHSNRVETYSHYVFIISLFSFQKDYQEFHPFKLAAFL